MMSQLTPHANVCQFVGITTAPWAIVTRFYGNGSLDHVIYDDSKAYRATGAFVQRVLLSVAR